MFLCHWKSAGVPVVTNSFSWRWGLHWVLITTASSELESVLFLFTSFWLSQGNFERARGGFKQGWCAHYYGLSLGLNGSLENRPFYLSSLLLFLNCSPARKAWIDCAFPLPWNEPVYHFCGCGNRRGGGDSGDKAPPNSLSGHLRPKAFCLQLLIFFFFQLLIFKEATYNWLGDWEGTMCIWWVIGIFISLWVFGPWPQDRCC